MRLINRYIAKECDIRNTAFGEVKIYAVYDSMGQTFVPEYDGILGFRNEVEKVCRPLNNEFSWYNYELQLYLNYFR